MAITKESMDNGEIMMMRKSVDLRAFEASNRRRERQRKPRDWIELS